MVLWGVNMFFYNDGNNIRNSRFKVYLDSDLLFVDYTALSRVGIELYVPNN